MNSSFKYTGLVPLTHLNTSMARRRTRFMRILSCPLILNMSSYVRDLSRYTVASARSCNFSSLFIFVLPHSIQTRWQYLRLVQIKDLYTFKRHCSSKNLDIRFSAFIWQDAVWHILRMCSLMFNLSSRVTPNIIQWLAMRNNVTTDIRIEAIDIASW